ncbi:MAG TPA: type II CAAX endopeptidase family protein [Rhizomicrobium sp.]|jgi:membrane protease YdiL (CAAX protease family)|nr:type II CAAX endopeptidase family protein [Rhizomicrobium sp.]
MTTYLEFAARGKNAWWRYAACVIAACIATVAIFAAVLLPLSITHVLPANFAAEIQQPTNPVVFFGVVALTFGSLLAGFALAIRLIHRKRIGDVMGSWNWRAFFLGACIWAVIQCASILIDFLIAPHSFSVSVSAETAVLAIVAFGGLSIQTFCEEFVFRGYITQGILLATKRPVLAAVLSGSLFGALHIWNGAPQAVGALFFGIVCSLIAIRTGSIAFTFGVHFVNNYMGAVAVVSAGDIFKNSPGILLQNAPQLLWWDIGVSIVGLIAVLTLVRRLGNPQAAVVPLGAR